MLTDKDKADLIRFGQKLYYGAQGNCTRLELAVCSTSKVLHFLIEHPDACAAEVDDYLRMSKKGTSQELDRLKQKGML